LDPSDPEGPKFGPRFEAALQFASQLHSRQTRKGTPIPYISHLLSVAALVIEDGGDEDEAIAGLLHDAIEDQGGLETRDEIRRRFGDRVATIVEGCTDAFTTPKPPWRARKEQHIAHLRAAPAEVLRVSAADKLHNARSILAELVRTGDAVWSRFRGGKEGTLWYYRTMTHALEEKGRGPLVQELNRVVTEMEKIAGAPNPSGPRRPSR
jgi:(p)ppGpp synthase/HD superfamily hydrolase